MEVVAGCCLNRVELAEKGLLKICMKRNSSESTQEWKVWVEPCHGLRTSTVIIKTYNKTCVISQRVVMMNISTDGLL